MDILFSLDTFIPDLSDDERFSILRSVATKYGLPEIGVSDEALDELIITVQQNHRSVEYHNFSHCISVVRAGCILSERCGLISKLGKVEKLALFVGTLCHDIDHRGFSNDELEKKNHPLGILYNGLSVMEMHHCAFTISMFEKSPKISSILGLLSQEEVNSFWRLVIDLIKATDLKKGNEIMDNIKSVIAKGINYDDSSDVKAVLELIIKSSDLYATCSPSSISQKWSTLVYQERFQKLPESEEKMAGGEIWFLTNMSLPLFNLLYSFDSCFDIERKQVMSNIEFWKSKK